MLVLLGNWGHTNYIGLTGIEIFDGDVSIPLSPNQLTCSLENQDLYRLINATNITTECHNMWLAPFNNDEISIAIDFKGFKYLSGLYSVYFILNIIKKS